MMASPRSTSFHEPLALYDYEPFDCETQPVASMCRGSHSLVICDWRFGDCADQVQINQSQIAQSHQPATASSFVANPRRSSLTTASTCRSVSATVTVCISRPPSSPCSI